MSAGAQLASFLHDRVRDRAREHRGDIDMRTGSWKYLIAAGLFTLGVGFSALAEEGKAEKAGKKVDETADKAEDGVKKTAKDTKRAAKRTKKKAGEKVEEAGDRMQN